MYNMRYSNREFKTQSLFPYCPPCPQPELNMGTTMHSDDDFLTILQQDQIEVLQVLHQHQGVYVGDRLQVNISVL